MSSPHVPACERAAAGSRRRMAREGGDEAQTDTKARDPGGRSAGVTLVPARPPAFAAGCGHGRTHERRDARPQRLHGVALAEARTALAAGEVPSAPSWCSAGASSAPASTSRSRAAIPTAHAEIVAIRDAARRVGNYRLTGATLYVTVEPCLMCVGALVHARVGRWSSAPRSRRPGPSCRTCAARELPALNHRFDVVQRRARGGVPRARSGVLPRSAEGEAPDVGETPLSDEPLGTGPPSLGKISVQSLRLVRRGTEVVVTGAPRKRLVG